MNKIRKGSRLHDLIMEVLRNNADLYQEVKMTLVNEEPNASANVITEQKMDDSVQPNEAELMRQLEIFIDEDFEEYDEVFRALA